MSKTIMLPHEVAKYIRFSKRHIIRLVTDGKIPGFKISNSWRFYKEEIDEWIKNGRNGK